MEALAGKRLGGFGEPERCAAERLIELAIAEDLPSGDPTSDALFPEPARTGASGTVASGTGASGTVASGTVASGTVASESGTGTGLVAEVVSREAGVACGVPVVELLFAALDPRVRVDPLCGEGGDLAPGTPLLRLSGPAASVLRGERIALNFLQRLSGIATRARLWSREVEGTEARLLDTRKTTPGWRALEKYAVRTGGAWNHRQSLSAAAMVKDNHAWLLRACGRGDVAEWVREIRAARPGVAVELEVDSRDEFLAARSAGADVILLDNFAVEDLRWAVEENRRLPGPRPQLEASGGIGAGRIAEVARTGVERISSGALIYGAPPLDLSLEAVGRDEIRPGGASG